MPVSEGKDEDASSSSMSSSSTNASEWSEEEEKEKNGAAVKNGDVGGGRLNGGGVGVGEDGEARVDNEGAMSEDAESGIADFHSDQNSMEGAVKPKKGRRSDESDDVG
jgi:hypothetical protein